jgi:hypothetical protein
MRSIHQQVKINWPVRALFNYVSDISNNASWQEHVEKTEWLNDERNTSGARFREVHKNADRDSYALCQIDEFVPYQKRSVVMQNKSFHSTYTYEFEPANESTVMKVTLEVRARGLYKLIEPFAANRFLQAQSRDIFRLKEMLELED